jgi:uncharacterized membrane protein YcaP (DUF421 family)
MGDLNFVEMLVPQQALEMVVRGSLIYVGLLVILRVILKRQSGNLASSDILVTVLIADAAQNGMAGDYKTIADGIILVTTIVAWDYLIDWASFKFAFIRRMISAPPLQLIAGGKLLRSNLRRELISEAELWIKLREEGIENLTEVKAAFMESDGNISVIKSS